MQIPVEAFQLRCAFARRVRPTLLSTASSILTKSIPFAEPSKQGLPRSPHAKANLNAYYVGSRNVRYRIEYKIARSM